jgi:hypothetical protein
MHIERWGCLQVKPEGETGERDGVQEGGAPKGGHNERLEPLSKRKVDMAAIDEDYGILRKACQQWTRNYTGGVISILIPTSLHVLESGDWASNVHSDSGSPLITLNIGSPSVPR